MAPVLVGVHASQEMRWRMPALACYNLLDPFLIAVEGGGASCGHQ